MYYSKETSSFSCTFFYCLIYVSVSDQKKNYRICVVFTLLISHWYLPFCAPVIKILVSGQSWPEKIRLDLKKLHDTNNKDFVENKLEEDKTILSWKETSALK